MSKIIQKDLFKNIWKKLDDNKDAIINMYLVDKQPLRVLSEKFGLGTAAIRAFLIDQNINLRSRYAPYKHAIDKTYFKNIDSNEKAYFLGWLFSDGCITKNNIISIQLLSKDRKILDLFKQSIKSDAPVKIQIRKKTLGAINNKNREMVGFRFSDKDIYNDLINLGMTQRKSLTLKFPKLDEQFIPAFLRGYFEGDGTLGIYENNNSSRLRFAFNFLATKEFGENLIKYFKEQLDLEFWTGPLRSKFTGELYNMYNFRLYGRPKILKTLNHLYKNCGEFYLDRKYNIYQEMLKYWNNLKDKPYVKWCNIE